MLWLGVTAVMLSGPCASIEARQLTLAEAYEIAVGETVRGEMIDGNLEVARQLYSARRINMYVPEISINGSVPSYRASQEYGPFRNAQDRRLLQRSNLNFNSFIELNQTLVTGGELTATADLIRSNERYPNPDFDPSLENFVLEDSRHGSFRFSLQQPLFRPSSVRNELNNRRDDLKIAEVTQTEEEATLKKDITEAYLGVLQKTLQTEMANDKLEQTRLQEEIDSAKLSDGVLSEEDYLLSTSARLDAELESHAVEIDLDEKRKELATLLDLDLSDELELEMPVITSPLTESDKSRYVGQWEESAPIAKARHVLAKAEREADFEAAGHGLTGDLTASYSFGDQSIETERLFYEFIDDTTRVLRYGTTDQAVSTNSWTVGLEFRLPLWDGGAGSAAVRAARYQAEQARYEYTRAERTARSQIVTLINQLDVSYRRLDIIRKQIELAEERLAIARERHADGRISRLTLLDSEIFLLETRDRYLEELKTYLLNRIDLESQYLS
jgi:outer membrane protein TolC